MAQTKHIESCSQSDSLISTKHIDSRSAYEHLRQASKNGELKRIKNGVYATPMSLASGIVDYDCIVPSGVLCLFSAFGVHKLSTQVESSACIAIESRRKVVLPDYPPITLYYWKKENLEWGVQIMDYGGFIIKVTDLERTVCDAIKYRNKIGIDVCAEVLNDYLLRSDRNMSLLNDYARRLRVSKILKFYLESRL